MDDERLAYLALAQVPGLGPRPPSDSARSLSTPHSAPIRRRSRFYAPCPGFPAPAPPPQGDAAGDRPTAALEARRAAGRAGPAARRRRSSRRCSARSPIRRRCCSRLGDPTLLSRPAARHRRQPGPLRLRRRRSAARVAARRPRAGVVVVSGMARGLDAVAHDRRARLPAAPPSACWATGSASSTPRPTARCTSGWPRTGCCSPSSRPASGPTPAAFPGGTGSSAASRGSRSWSRPRSARAR